MSESPVTMPDCNSKRVCGLEARIITNSPICREHVEIELQLGHFPHSVPGQFLELRCGDAEERAPHAMEWRPGGFPSLAANEEWERRHTFLRRPFSIADRWTDSESRSHLVIISRTVGPGTASLEQLAPGDTLDVTGPLGHGFAIPELGTPLVLIGGGVGIPPMIYLARRLKDSGHSDVTMIFGATTGDLLPVRLHSEPAADGTPRDCIELKSGARYATAITTDDGSLGLRGVVTDALTRWVEKRSPEQRKASVVYACGPDGMLRAVARMTRETGLNCQVCIERNMGCGLGTCLSCIVQVCDATKAAGWRWALTCSDGPVFDRDQLYEYLQL